MINRYIVRLTLALGLLNIATFGAETYYFQDGKLVHGSFCEGQLVQPLRGVVLTKDPKEVTQLRKSVAAQTLVVLQKSTHPMKGLEALLLRPKSLVVMADIPSSAAHASKIHGIRAISQIPPSYYTDISERYKRFCKYNFPEPNGVVTQVIPLRAEKEPTIALEVKLRLNMLSEHDLTVVVGHVDSKGDMHFSDGSTIAIAGQYRPRIWWLACNTLDLLDPPDNFGFATGTALTYDQAFWALGKIIGSFASGPSSFFDVLHDLQAGTNLSEKSPATTDTEAVEAQKIVMEKPPVAIVQATETSLLIGVPNVANLALIIQHNAQLATFTR